MENTAAEVPATLIAMRSATDCRVRLADGEEVAAVLDAESLRREHGRVYGVRLGGPVRVVCGRGQEPAHIVWIEQMLA